MRPTRLERATFGFEVHCSIQLSYERVLLHGSTLESGCLVGFEPTTTRSTIWRSTPELQAPCNQRNRIYLNYFRWSSRKCKISEKKFHLKNSPRILTAIRANDTAKHAKSRALYGYFFRQQPDVRSLNPRKSAAIAVPLVLRTEETKRGAHKGKINAIFFSGFFVSSWIPREVWAS